MTDREEFSPLVGIEERSIEDGLRSWGTGVYEHLSSDELYRRQGIVHAAGNTLPAAHSPHPYDARIKATGDSWQTVICPQCDGQHMLPGPDGDPEDCPLCRGLGVCHINEAQIFLDAVDNAAADADKHAP